MPEKVKNDWSFFHELGHAEGTDKGNLFHKKWIGRARATSPVKSIGLGLGIQAAGAAYGTNKIQKATTNAEIDKNLNIAKNINTISAIGHSLKSVPVLGQELEASWRGARMLVKHRGLKGISKIRSLRTFSGVPSYLLAETGAPIAGKIISDYTANEAARERKNTLAIRPQTKVASALVPTDIIETTAIDLGEAPKHEKLLLHLKRNKNKYALGLGALGTGLTLYNYNKKR